MRKRVFFIYTERYSDFNSMIERYEKEMRRLFEEKQKNSGFEQPAVQTAVFPEDAPSVPRFQEREQDNTEVPEGSNPVVPLPRFEEPPRIPSSANDESMTGTIIAEITTARGAVPLSGVTVVIDRLDADDSRGRKELIAVEETNRSGRTEPVKVKAAPRDSSLEPGKTDPFTTFYISAKRDDFEPVKDRPVDVFADEISILKIDLIPKPENLAGGEIF